MTYEIDIFHYIDIYKKSWKRLVVLMCIGMLIAIITGNMQAITYRSTAIVLSPKESVEAGGLGKFLGLSSVSSSDDLVFSMLKSRRMANDINEHFNTEGRRKFWWSLDTYVVTGGFAVEVKGSDPVITQDIANFAIENLNNINAELDVTPKKFMVKVLDPALKGAPVNRNISKKAISTGFAVFLVYTLFIFFRQYFSQLKASRKI